MTPHSPLSTTPNRAVADVLSTKSEVVAVTFVSFRIDDMATGIRSVQRPCLSFRSSCFRVTSLLQVGWLTMSDEVLDRHWHDVDQTHLFEFSGDIELYPEVKT